MAVQGKRYQARCLALQATYALGEELNGPLDAAAAKAENDASVYDERVLEGICAAWEAEKDRAIADLTAALEEPWERFSLIERCCMLLAVVELRSALDTPRNVAISQWVEACKEYGSATGYKMVNAVLDGMELG